MERTSGGSRGGKREEVYIQEVNVGGIWENGIKQWEQRMEVYKATTKSERGSLPLSLAYMQTYRTYAAISEGGGALLKLIRSSVFRPSHIAYNSSSSLAFSISMYPNTPATTSSILATPASVKPMPKPYRSKPLVVENGSAKNETAVAQE